MKLPPVRKRPSYADIGADDLTFALFSDRILDSMAGAMGDAGPTGDPESSFAVFKDSRGAPRWITRTTTAYRDRDGEIIATDALMENAARMKASGQYGPLRLWHIGKPDPLDPDAPWGPGLDVGDCDYATVIGKTLIESGTFRDPDLAARIARAPGGWEVSPGFFHPADQPDREGVFSTIKQFERSIVPKRHGRASNLFTGLTTYKESTMNQGEIQRRMQALAIDLGVDPDQLQTLAGDLLTTEKAADRVAYKSDDDDAPPPSLTINGATYILQETATKDDGEGDMEVAAEEAPEDGDVAVPEGGMAYVGDMSPDEFFTSMKAALSEVLAPAMKMDEMLKSMGAMHGELKNMFTGTATKEEQTAAEVLTLKEQIATLQGRLADLEGDQPAHRADDIAAALKSDGPRAPDAPDAPKIIVDPDRPFAGWAALTFPDLYKQADS